MDIKEVKMSEKQFNQLFGENHNRQVNFVKQSFEILSIPENPLKQIELAARTCYKTEEKIKPEGNENFIRMLLKNKHDAMIEFSDITVKFITNRGVTHELVRHRLCSFAQESTRYVNYKGKKMTFIIPVWLERDFNEILENSNSPPAGDVIAFIVACEDSQKFYNELIVDFDWSPQQAREVLPNALKTEIIVKANIREWRHILKLRCSENAHPQMKGLMRPLKIALMDLYPALFGDFGWGAPLFSEK